jgi:hypothetical protein
VLHMLQDESCVHWIQFVGHGKHDVSVDDK